MKDEFDGMEEPLERVVAAWRAEVECESPPPEIAAAVSRECRRSVAVRRRSRWVRVLAPAAGAAALGVAWLGWTGRNSGELIPPRASDAPFVALPYVVPPARFELTEVVRINVPVAELISLGLRLPYAPARRAEADVLIGQDGRARAVRVVSILD